MDIGDAVDIARECVDNSTDTKNGGLSEAILEMCNYIWKQDRKIAKVKEVLEDIGESHNADKSASLAQRGLELIK